MIHEHHHVVTNILHLLTGGGLGLVAASLAHHFGTRSADRLPGESRRPQCVFCLQPLSWQSICPLFGWLLRSDTLKLPCPCGRRQGLWPQPVAELLGFACGLAALFLGGWNWAAAPLAIGLGLLPAMALIDFQFGIIPDGLNLLLGLFGLAWLLLGGGDLYLGLIVAAVLLAVGLFCALAYSRWRGREMLGIGDVKFLAAAGFWLQPPTVAPFLIVAGVCGALIGTLWKRSGGGKEFPFAPALCLSLAFCVLYQLLMLP